MKRSRVGLPVPGEMEPPTEARMTFESEKNLKDLEGHLRHRLLNNQQLSSLPNSSGFGKPSWLTPLLATVEFTARGHMHRWGLVPLMIFARHYDEMLIHWSAIGALAELWHPQTHTFIFPSFEATILLEEVRLFLGLGRFEAANHTVAHSMKLVNTKDFLSKLTGDRMQARNIACTKGIRLSVLAAWAVKAKDQGKGDESIAQALSLCLAGLLLFPHHDDILNCEHIGVIQSAWQGRSMAQPILAHLYSGLTSASMGKVFFGSAILLDIWLSFHVKLDFGMDEDDKRLRKYEDSPIYRVRHALKFLDTMVVKTLKLHFREDWRNFFARLPYCEFTFSSEALTSLKIKSRPLPGVDLHLVGSKELVLYNAHRCYLQLGQPRQVIPLLSHHPPIESRDFDTNHDHIFVRTCLELWNLGHVSTVGRSFAEEDKELLKKYVFWLRRLRSIQT